MLLIENIFRVSLQHEIEGKLTCSIGERGSGEIFGDALAKKKVTLNWLVNSNMVKPEKLDYLYLVYRFTVP